MAKLSDESNLRAGLPESIYGNLDQSTPTLNPRTDSVVSRIDREVVPSLEKSDAKEADVTLTQLKSEALSNPADEDRIRERAYDLYVQSGYADGHADEHWYIARREVEKLSSDTLPSEMKTASKSPSVVEPTFPTRAQTEQRTDKKVA